MDATLSESFFLGRGFRFMRGNGETICQNLVLGHDHAIVGYTHPNEASWSFDDATLAFRNNEGVITTLFDRAEWTDSGWTFFGRWVGDQNETVAHILVENGVDQRTLPTISRIQNPSAARSRDVAVLVRTHKADAKFDDLLHKLRVKQENYDLYPLVDDTAGRAREIDNAIWHSVASCRELGLTHPRPLLLLHCGDFPLYAALKAIPGYKFYLMIEDDVDLTKDDGSFINFVCDRLAEPAHAHLDFVGLRYCWNPGGAGHQQALAELFAEAHRYYAYFPFVIASHRALAYLFAQRQLEAIRRPNVGDIIHCETFVPSCLHAGGFNCCDLAELAPGSYTVETITMQAGDGCGKPLGAALPVPEEIQIVHPVYSHEEYLDRAYQKFGIGLNQWNVLMRLLEGGDAAHIRSDLKMKIIDRMPESALAAL